MVKIARRIGLVVAALCVAGFGYVTFFTNHVYVTTPSMWPTIPPGSLVFISPEPTYHVGEVIEFHGGGLDYMHRIIKVAPNGDITTKGDNPQNSPDIFNPPTTRADVVGKDVLSIPYLGFPELILHHPLYGLSWLRAELGFTGRILVVAVVAFFLLLPSLVAGLRGRAGDRPPSRRFGHLGRHSAA